MPEKPWDWGDLNRWRRIVWEGNGVMNSYDRGVSGALGWNAQKNKIFFFTFALASVLLRE
jgi:hypothetical protein